MDYNNGEKKPEDEVVEAAVEVKKSEGQKVIEAFLPPGGLNGMKDRIIFDTLIPTVKKVIMDTVETMLHGSVGAGRKASGAGQPKQYDGYFGRRESERDQSRLRPQSAPVVKTVSNIRGYQYEDVTVNSRAQALNIVACMKDIIREYECVCVADLYEMVGIPQEYTDQNFGWLEIEDAQVASLRSGGFVIHLPYPVQLPRALKVK